MKKLLFGLLAVASFLLLTPEAGAHQIQETTKKSIRGRSYMDVSTDKGKYIGTYEAGNGTDRDALVAKAKEAEAAGK